MLVFQSTFHKQLKKIKILFGKKVKHHEELALAIERDKISHVCIRVKNPNLSHNNYNLY